MISKNKSLQKTRIKVKHLQDKLSRRKKFREPANAAKLCHTTNHRFVALFMRWGKKSKSYGALLNTFNQCKQLFYPLLQNEEKSLGFAYPTLHGTQSKRIANLDSIMNNHASVVFSKRNNAKLDYVRDNRAGVDKPVRTNHRATVYLVRKNEKPILSDTPKKDLQTIFKQIIDPPLGVKGYHKELIERAQGSKKQDFNKIPKSVLIKKDINVTSFRKSLGIERATIADNSVSRVCPTLETRKVRIGGATYAVPYVPHKRRQEGVGIRWLIASASSKRQKSKNHSDFCLANELFDSLQNHGESFKKRDQSHQVAANNRAYTRYRWW